MHDGDHPRDGDRPRDSDHSDYHPYPSDNNLYPPDHPGNHPGCPGHV